MYILFYAKYHNIYYKRIYIENIFKRNLMFYKHKMDSSESIGVTTTYAVDDYPVAPSRPELCQKYY